MTPVCEHCAKGLQLYSSGVHNTGDGRWERCPRVKYETELAAPWEFVKVLFTERGAKSEITKQRNRGLAAGWGISRNQSPKFYAIFRSKLA